MRLHSCLLIPACVFFAVAARAEQTFPYKAYVAAEDVYVRSGPGRNYYPTGKLRLGQEVEVHRHDPGGWFAIRPPEGSFTWVSGRYLQKKEKGLAVVIGDRVAARVGSELSDIRDVIQVRLERGEVVEIIGQKQFAAGSEAGTWYKIAPPSGEFRWVFGKHVDKDYASEGVRKNSNEESASARPASSAVVSPAKASTGSTSPGDAAPAPQSRMAMASQSSGRPGSGSWSRATSGSTTIEVVAPVTPAPAALPAQTAVDPSIAPPMRRISPEEFKEELDALDTQLAVMLAEEPSVWEFGELDRKAQWLFAQAETAVERGRARLLMNKIAQASDIKRRTDEMNNAQVEIERNNRQMAELAQQRAAAVRQPDARGGFDGYGRLTRVVPSKVGAPHYALLDERGSVRCYVTPAPGVNLRYYEGRQVGVNGIRGYIADQNAQHVTAKHVTALEDRRWR